MSRVLCDTGEYRKLYGNRAVQKTLTIPSGLHILLERAGIRFLSVLQEALKVKLNIR